MRSLVWRLVMLLPLNWILKLRCWSRYPKDPNVRCHHYLFHKGPHELPGFLCSYQWGTLLITPDEIKAASAPEVRK